MAIKYDSQGTDPNVDFIYWTDEAKGYDEEDVLVLKEDDNVRWSAGLTTSWPIKTNSSSAYVHITAAEKTDTGANRYNYDPHSYYTYNEWKNVYSYGNNYIATSDKIRYNDPFEIIGKSNYHTACNSTGSLFTTNPVITWSTWKTMGSDFHAELDDYNQIKPFALTLENYCATPKDFLSYNYVLVAYSNKENLSLDFSPRADSLYGVCYSDSTYYPYQIIEREGESWVIYQQIAETATTKPAYIELSADDTSQPSISDSADFYLYATLLKDVVFDGITGKKIPDSGPDSWTLISGQPGKTGARYLVGKKSLKATMHGYQSYSSSTIDLADSDLVAPIITSADWWDSNASASTVTYSFKIQNNNNMDLKCAVWTNEQAQNPIITTVNAQSSKTVGMTFQPGDVYFIFYTDNESNCSAKTTKTIEAYPVYITKGSNVNAVWLSTKTYLGGRKHASGTLFPKNTTVRGFAQLDDGYVLGDDSTYLGKDISLESNNKVYRVPGSLIVTNPAYWSFGTITGLELSTPAISSATYSLSTGRKVQYTINVSNLNSFAVTATYSSSTPSVDGSNTISATSQGSYSGVATGLVPMGAQAYVKFSKDGETTSWSSATWEAGESGNIQLQ